MVEFKWIKMSLFLIAVLQFTAAEKLSFTVRDGDEVTLPCENVKDGQPKWVDTTWVFSGDSRNTITLFELEKIHENAKSKSDRLSVTANCSLVIKKVTVEDVGRYFCQQYKSGEKESPDAEVYLSLITSEDSITTTTKPPTTENSKKTGTTTTASTTTDASTELRDDTQTSTTKSTRTAEDNTAVTTTTATNESSTKLQGSTLEGRNKTSSAEDQTTTKQGWWWPIIVFVAVAALLIIVVVVIRWKRTKGKKTQMDENTADPEDGVSYASISYTKNSNSKARVRGKDDDGDEDEAVTYSTVKASSSSAGASADPSDLYATVNNPNK